MRGVGTIGSVAYNCALGNGVNLSARRAFALCSRPRFFILARLGKSNDFIRDASHRLLKYIDDTHRWRGASPPSVKPRWSRPATSPRHVWRFAETPSFSLAPAQELLQLLPQNFCNGLLTQHARAIGPMPGRRLLYARKCKRQHLWIPCRGAPLGGPDTTQSSKCGIATRDRNSDEKAGM